MRKPVDHRAMAVAGFAEPWSAPAGTRRLLALSCDRPIGTVGIRRLDRDGSPAMDWPVEILSDAPAHRDFAQGSWARVDGLDALGRAGNLTFELQLTHNPGRRALLDCGTFTILLVDHRLRLRTDAGEIEVGALPSRLWLQISVDFAADRIGIVSLEPFRPFALEAHCPLPQPAGFWLFTDGRLEMPTLNCRLGRMQLEGAAGRATWAFPTLFTKQPIAAHGLPLRLTLAGTPTFCVTSPRWDGTSLDPRPTPTHYDAVHFHDTDMAGLDWPPSFAADIPADAESGAYAFEITAGAVTERVTFFVAAAEPKAPLLFVVPISTYLAYADEYLPPHLYEWIGTDRGHEFARDNGLRSLYDYHSDHSGVSLTATRRPKATLRDDYRYPLCGGPHGLPVDLHFLRFCARSGIAIDVTTDFEVHVDGAALLGRYRGVVTGSHPEYQSSAMEDAYRNYIGAGGRLAYLGGNGFAAVAAFSDDVMELRRGPTQAGRTWDGPLAEMHLALTNEPGGYFRDRGRGEYSLLGVGIALMGFSRSIPFTRTSASHAPEFDFLFEDVTADSFGHEGIVLGGAAGYEVDCVSRHLGSPDDIVVLATAEGFPDDYVGDPGKWYEGGVPEQQAQRRADMTYWRHPSGGVVFSASSVAWCGALPGPGDENDVGRITRNLLTRFSK